MSSALKSSALQTPALKWIPLALITAMALSGCAREGFYDDRNLDYVDVESGSPLSLPETRNEARYGNALPVPEVGSPARLSGPAEVRPPQPLTLAGGIESSFVESREIGDQRWLVVAADAGTVWPLLESFIRTQPVDVNRVSPSQGVIDMQQGQIRLQSALRAGSSEVRCERQGSPLPSCLDALDDFISARASNQSTALSSSLNAQRWADQQAPMFRQEGEQWTVSIPHGADRVWAELDHFLELDFDEEGERDVIEARPSEYAFVVEYTPRALRNFSLWSRMMNPLTNTSPYRVRLTLEPGGDQSVLRAESAGERELSAEHERELLERVAGYLR
ncbi:lipoprotein, NlpB [Halomonas alkaliantarctica]|nr:lipoprotein, NlpB [Halomonas alkaliantarctica]